MPMSYGGFDKSSVLNDTNMYMSYGWFTKLFVWHNNSTPTSYVGVNKSSERDTGILLLSHTDDLVSHPYDLATIHSCHTYESLSYPYGLATVYPHMAVILYWRFARDDEMACKHLAHYCIFLAKNDQPPVDIPHTKAQWNFQVFIVSV